MSNCKVHLVIDNDVRQTLAMRSAGANYALFSAYQFIATKKQSYATEITPNWFKFNHVIVDSGLFTLMFGAKKDQKLEYADLYDWMQRLAQFANENDVMLSHAMGVPMLLAPCDGCLIVDDICDGGLTLQHFRDTLDCKIATMYYVDGATVTPDYWMYQKLRGDWVLFPWEVQNG